MNSILDEQKVRSCFDAHFSNCYAILRQSDVQLAPPIVLDLYAILYVVSYFAATTDTYCKAISDVIFDSIFAKISMVYAKPPVDNLGNRISFYESVFNGLDLHAHCLPGVDITNAHPVVRCSIAFSDCCLYSSYIDNYQSPAPLFSALDTFEIATEIMEPLNSELSSLYRNMRDICASIDPSAVPISKAPPVPISKKDLSDNNQAAAKANTKPSVVKAILFSFLSFAAFYLLCVVFGLIFSLLYVILKVIPVVGTLVDTLFEARGDGPAIAIPYLYLCFSYYATVSIAERIVKHVPTLCLTYKLLGIYLTSLNAIFLLINIIGGGAWAINIGNIIAGIAFLVKASKSSAST